VAQVLIGAKLRDRRKGLGLTQAALAQQVGISASYLNLIESNRRNIGGALLKRVADALGVAVDQFDGAAERRLVSELGAITVEPMLEALALEADSAAALASQHAGWARALVSLHRAYQDRRAAVDTLTDRLNQDPVLAQGVHSLLTHVTAIRSAAEILEGDDGLNAAQRARFVGMIGSEGRRLSELSQSLAGLFMQDNTATRQMPPEQEIDDFLIANENHFPALERAADTLRVELGLIADDGMSGALCTLLQQRHGVRLLQPSTQGVGEAGTSQPQFDRDTRTLTLPTGLPAPTRRFVLASVLVELAAAPAVNAEVNASTALASAPAREQAMRALYAYMAAALLMPYDAFRAAALAARYDIDHLARRFQASVEQVCHRLVTLRRPGQEGLRFGFMRADAAGHVSKRFPLPRLALPRHGTACPLWPLYRAFQTAGEMLRQLVEFPSGARFLMVACTVDKGDPAFAMPRQRLSVMLVCDALHADQLVYGDGLNLSSTAAHTPVGPACRVCTRPQCSWRQEAPIIDSARLQGLSVA
jgi:predicted transcriptional regulator/transcriptional regulator with XRE-family HTH domain